MRREIRPDLKDVKSVKRKNRPDIKDARPKRVMFGDVGSTGWRRRRDIRNHKRNRQEGDFSHLHDKFTEEEA